MNSVLRNPGSVFMNKPNGVRFGTAANRSALARLLALSTSVSFFICGCASTHSAEVHDRNDPYQAKGRIQWNSSNLKSSLSIDKAVADRTTDGLLRVRMVVRNKTKSDVVVDIRVVYTDKDGFESQRTPWEPIVCTARTQTTFENVSLGSNVDDFQLIIRDPRKFSK